ncbi:hypothetical protein [Clostridioides difficile]|uniref:hypothetical protein n=1 Tax=Clostridioides difficile TaxID=1496 RepID=UPI0021C7B243|nr:hypothetical protein [Clostridioides difficile]UUV13088.1 hypothetical protein NQ183_10880 [Clostridioides difficile]
MSKVIQCDFCKEIFEENNLECIELYKNNSVNELISTNKHMCPACYEKFAGEKVEKKITNFEKVTRDKDSLMELLFKCDAECSCCVYVDKNECYYPTSCIAGCENWLEMEVGL